MKCVQEDYNLYSKSSPSVRIVKFNKSLSTGQGNPFGCSRVKEMAFSKFPDFCLKTRFWGIMAAF